MAQVQGRRQHSAIEMNDDDPPSISSTGKKDSYDELMSTYVLPDSGSKIGYGQPVDIWAMGVTLYCMLIQFRRSGVFT